MVDDSIRFEGYYCNLTIVYSILFLMKPDKEVEIL